MDKNRLALLQLCVAHESEVGRDADQRAGCRLFVRDVMGRRIQPAFVHCAIFSEGALPAQQALIAAPDTVARLEPRDAGTDLSHRAREVAADDERRGQRHLNHAGADVRIDRVERDGADFHQALSRARFRRRHVAVEDVFRRAGLIDVGGFHRFP